MSGAPLQPLIQSRILSLRNQRVMLDADLAQLYGVETRAVVQAVKRNAQRFPADFMFQLNADEWESLRSQTVISNAAGVGVGRGGRRTAPYAFTEQGVAMLSSVLSSERAVAVNIEIMRTFVKLRGMLAEHSDLKRKLNTLEKKYDENFRMVFDAIHELMDEPVPGAYGRRRIGFTKEK